MQRLIILELVDVECKPIEVECAFGLVFLGRIELVGLEDDLLTQFSWEGEEGCRRALKSRVFGTVGLRRVRHCGL